MQSSINRFNIKRDGEEIQLTKDELDAIITLHERENIRRTIVKWAGSSLSPSGKREDKEIERLLIDERFVRKLIESFDYPFFEQMHKDVIEDAAAILDFITDIFLRERIKAVQEEI